MTFQNPRIRVREARPEDRDDVIRVFYAAFDDDVMHQLMHPNGISEDDKQGFGDRTFVKAQPGKRGQPKLFVAEYFSPETHPTFDPETYPDDGSGEIVAFAKWTFHTEPRTDEEWQAEQFSAEHFGDGCDLAVVDAFIGGLNGKQKESAKGEAALFLGILGCDPKRQRLGAGSALVKFGADIADSLNLPCRLEASPMGYSVYKRLGYEALDALDMKVTETWGVKPEGRYWGANNAVDVCGPVPEGVHRTVIMRRPPKV
ncbi:hypothetical protein QBC38DRAFT_258894 [Podospora fimiseda]|uniref:N-acetyltransferase domain-containing protein n=1 Tax=Podospora fimiseda TaxID=252190 RepID=A0AAN7H0U0_9PEZI|nr:hypothetical protein QBC38DRAFT_258894 [Podospora fimiseda]